MTSPNKRRQSPEWLDHGNGATDIDGIDIATEENEPLLQGKPLATKSSIWSPPIRGYVPIEVIAFCYMFSIVLCLPLIQFYLFDKIAESYGGVNRTEEVVCGVNETENSLEVLVQSKAADATMFLIFSSSFPGILQTFVMGALSDRYGRRGGLFLALFGLLVRLIIYIIVFEYNLDLYILFVGNIIDGLTGSFGTVLTCMFGVVADITSPGHKRAQRIAIVQAVMALSSALGMLVSGIWISESGYKQPTYFVLALTAFCFIFSIFVLPETRRNVSKEPVPIKEHIKSLKRSFQLYTKDTPEKRRWKLVVSLFTFITSFSVDLAKATVLILYLLASPLCWQRTSITTYSAVRAVVNWLCIISVTQTCGRRVSEITIAIIACLSNCLFLVFLGIGQWDFMIYIAAVLGVLAEASPPMMRAVMSRLVSPDEQGALFASVSAVEVLETAVLGVLVTLIYRASLTFFPGLVFLILAFFTLLTAALLLVLRHGMKKEQRQNEGKTLVVEPQ